MVKIPEDKDLEKLDIPEIKEEISEEVIDVVGKDVGGAEEKLLTPDVLQLQKERKASFYSDLIFMLTNLQFSEEESRRYWDKILKHKYIVSQQLGRNIGIRVATIDYFMNITHKIKGITVVNTESYQRIAQLATRDGLTGLYNRQQFDNLFGEQIETAQKENTPFSLFMFDLDNFKLYNDTNGHLAGDMVLREIADIMERTFRSEDILARYGGEEFIVILPGLKGPETFSLSEKFRETVANQNFAGAELTETHKITVSGGIAVFPEQAREQERLIKLADGLLYKAKREGKNRVYFN